MRASGMMKSVEKTHKPFASFSLNPKQEDRFWPRYSESPEMEHEAPAGRGAPFSSYNLVNLPRFPEVQRKEPEDEEFQMKPSGICPECDEEIQSKSMGDSVTPTVQKQAELKPNRTGMPNQLKEGIESLSGLDISDIRVHINSDKPARLNALAYARGNEIHLGPGQERHLPHEAWHVVQQSQGRVKPTMQMKDGALVNDDAGLERESDEMGRTAQTNLESRGLVKYHKNELRHIAQPCRVAQAVPDRFIKDLKNILTFGIRKLYVNRKRARRARHNGQQTNPLGQFNQQVTHPVEEDVPRLTSEMTPQDQFVDAYEKARFYHSTHPQNLDSIEKKGLLNLTDRNKDPELQDIGGMSSLGGSGGEFAGDEKKGVYIAGKELVRENFPSTLYNPVVRAFLPADRTRTHTAFEKDVPGRELQYDKNFPGKAFITKESIPSGLVTTRPMLDENDRLNPKTQSILEAILTHYPQGAHRPSVEDMEKLLRDAIRARRLSNAAFSDSREPFERLTKIS